MGRSVIWWGSWHQSLYASAELLTGSGKQGPGQAVNSEDLPLECLPWYLLSPPLLSCPCRDSSLNGNVKGPCPCFHLFGYSPNLFSPFCLSHPIADVAWEFVCRKSSWSCWREAWQMDHPHCPDQNFFFRVWWLRTANLRWSSCLHR